MKKMKKWPTRTFCELFIWTVQGRLVNWIRIRIPDPYSNTSMRIRFRNPGWGVNQNISKIRDSTPFCCMNLCELLKVLTETCLQVPGQFKLASSWLPRKTLNKKWVKLFVSIFWQGNLALFYAKLYMLKKLHWTRTYSTYSITSVKKSVAQVFFVYMLKKLHRTRTLQD